MPSMRGLLSRLLRLIRGTPPFDHRVAQRYELESAKRTIREAYPELLNRWRVAVSRRDPWHGPNNMWFQHDVALWEGFAAHVRDRKCLEIGAGPFGFMAPAWWIKDRIVIDPLAQSYRDYEIELCGESWFDSGVSLISAPAERIAPELIGRVDGCIVCQNALDHCEDPLSVLEAISQYAAPGCWLLLWTDIWHLQHLDEGHQNLTRSPRVMDALLIGLDFDIVRSARAVRNPVQYIEYGRIARKRSP